MINHNHMPGQCTGSMVWQWLIGGEDSEDSEAELEAGRQATVLQKVPIIHAAIEPGLSGLGLGLSTQDEMMKLLNEYSSSKQ
jgi:hypothetical protein